MITKKQIIQEGYKIHKGKYDYSISEDIKNVNEKIKYICPIHGVREQTYWNNIKQGKECAKCSYEKRGLNKRLTKDEFIERSILTHGDIENYDLTNVDMNAKDNNGRIVLRCKKHGEFKIRPSHFMNGVGCQFCCNRQKSDVDVINELSVLHPNLDFSESKYSERDEHYKIKVKCQKHGYRHLNYYNLLNGQGCDLCRWEKGFGNWKLEKEIENILLSNNIKFEREKRFKWGGNLRLDFFLTDYNIGIECQGIQHFIPKDRYGGVEKFQEGQERDKRKRDLCETNHVKLLYFSHEKISYPYIVFTDSQKLIDFILKT